MTNTGPHPQAQSSWAAPMEVGHGVGTARSHRGRWSTALRSVFFTVLVGGGVKKREISSNTEPVSEYGALEVKT